MMCPWSLRRGRSRRYTGGCADTATTRCARTGWRWLSARWRHDVRQFRHLRRQSDRGRDSDRVRLLDGSELVCTLLPAGPPLVALRDGSLGKGFRNVRPSVSPDAAIWLTLNSRGKLAVRAVGGKGRPHRFPMVGMGANLADAEAFLHLEPLERNGTVIAFQWHGFRHPPGHGVPVAPKCHCRLGCCLAHMHTALTRRVLLHAQEIPRHAIIQVQSWRSVVVPRQAPAGNRDSATFQSRIPTPASFSSWPRCVVPAFGMAGCSGFDPIWGCFRLKPCYCHRRQQASRG